MAAAWPEEERSRAALARGLLKADGSLSGPAVLVNGAEVMAGDRVLIGEDPVSGTEEGMPGTVREVDADRGTVEIDFATWGRLQASLSDAVVQSLRHDYVARAGADAPGRPDPATLALEVDRIAPEAEW